MTAPEQVVAELPGVDVHDVEPTATSRRGERTVTTAVLRQDRSVVVLKTYGPHDAEGDGTWAARVGRQPIAGCGSLARAASFDKVA